MSAMRVFQCVASPCFSWSDRHNVNKNSSTQVNKRRKTQNTSFPTVWGDRCDMETEDCVSTTGSNSITTAHGCGGSDDLCEGGLSLGIKESAPEPLARCSSPPSDYLLRALAHRGLPHRLDPLSFDHFMYFEKSETGFRSQDIPSEVLNAVKQGDVSQLVEIAMIKDNCDKARHFKSFRSISDGESLLHVACRWGRWKIVEWLLQADVALPTFVLDRCGRTPLHSACMAAMQSSSEDISAHTEDTNHIKIIQQLLHQAPILALYVDRQGKIPFDFFERDGSYEEEALRHRVNVLLGQEYFVDRIVQKLSHHVQHLQFGQGMTVMEKVDCLVNLDGVDAAILEAGFSV